MLGMVASAFAISLTLRLHQEESSQRAETLLAGCGEPNSLAGKPSGVRDRWEPAVGDAARRHWSPG